MDRVTTEELAGALLLSGLTPEQRQRVANHAVRLTLGEGRLLFTQGSPADRFFLVRKGQIRLFRLSPEGSEKVIEIVGTGQTFAEALMFLKAPRYPVCAAALCPTELIAMDARDFCQMLRESIDTCFVLLGLLSQRLRGLIGEIDNLTLHTATGRMARYFLKHLPASGQVLILQVRKGVLASRLSIKPETFSRVEKSLSDQGIIRVRGNRVTVLDREALEEIAKLGDSAELDLMPCIAPPALKS